MLVGTSSCSNSVYRKPNHLSNGEIISNICDHHAHNSNNNISSTASNNLIHMSSQQQMHQEHQLNPIEKFESIDLDTSNNMTGSRSFNDSNVVEIISFHIEKI